MTTVIFGRNELIQPGSNVHHWALKVGDTWYENDGKSLVTSTGSLSKVDAKAHQNLGKTNKTNSDIKKFNKKFQDENPTYNLLTNNCQHYVKKLHKFLHDDSDTGLKGLGDTTTKAFGKSPLGMISKELMKSFNEHLNTI